MNIAKIIEESLSSTIIDNVIQKIDSGQFDRFVCLRLIDKLYDDAKPTEKELQGSTPKESKQDLRDLLASIKEAETSDVARELEVEALLLLEKLLKKLEQKDRQQVEIPST